VQRYMTSSKLKDSNKTFYLNVAAILPTQIIFFTLGTCLYVFYKLNPLNISKLDMDYDAILPWFIVNELPVGLSGLLIAGILSAAMSSLSSSINSSATTYVTDIHKKLRTELLDHDLLITARAASLIIGVSGTLLAAWMALSDIKSLWDEFIKILGLFTGGLGGLFLLGMTTKRPSGQAAVFGLILSGFTQFIIVNNTEIHSLLYAATGIISCFVFGYVSSFFFPKNKQNIYGLTINATEKKKK